MGMQKYQGQNLHHQQRYPNQRISQLFVRPGAALAKSRMVFFLNQETHLLQEEQLQWVLGRIERNPPSEVKLIAIRDSFLINGKIFNILD